MAKNGSQRSQFQEFEASEKLQQRHGFPEMATRAEGVPAPVAALQAVGVRFPSLEPLCSAPWKDRKVWFCPAVGAWRWSPAAIVAVLRFHGALGGPAQTSAILKHVWGVCVGELGVAHSNNPASFSYTRGRSVGLQIPCGLQLSYRVDPGV